MLYFALLVISIVLVIGMIRTQKKIREELNPDTLVGDEKWC